MKKTTKYTIKRVSSANNKSPKKTFKKTKGGREYTVHTVSVGLASSPRHMAWRQGAHSPSKRTTKTGRTFLIFPTEVKSNTSKRVYSIKTVG